MPKLAVIGGVATGVQPPYGLFVGGTDVLKDYTGAAYGVPLESIEVTEAGPGSVSSMTFRIDDPSKLMALAEGQEARFYDFTNSVTEFLGYVDHWSSTPDFGGQGRTYEVTCTGIEAWLDWAILQNDYPRGGGASTVSPLDFFELRGTTPQYWGPFYYGVSATQITGERLAGLGTFSGYNTYRTSTITYAAGTTLRGMFDSVSSYTYIIPGDGRYIPINVLATIDFDRQARAWPSADVSGNLLQPSDYTTLTVTDTAASATNAEDLEYQVEPGDPAHEVYIKGTGVTGVFTDGTGIRTRQLFLSDASIANADDAQRVANGLLGSVSGSVRGSYWRRDFTPPAGVHAGSLTTITDDATGATGTYRIYQIRKTYLGSGRKTWYVAFGGNPPSAAALVRKLTRSVAA